MDNFLFKLIFILIFFNLYNPVFSKKKFSCKILHELENDKPAEKKKYEINQLEFFLDPENKWVNDLPKSKWLEIEKDNLDRIKTNFLKKKKTYKFFYKRYYSEKKINIELSYQINFDELTGLMTFPKKYFDYKNQLFFSSEVRGICKKN